MTMWRMGYVRVVMRMRRMAIALDAMANTKATTPPLPNFHPIPILILPHLSKFSTA
jgi:hypothetical protein